jgi:hypothetical protein
MEMIGRGLAGMGISNSEPSTSGRGEKPKAKAVVSWPLRPRCDEDEFEEEDEDETDDEFEAEDEDETDDEFETDDEDETEDEFEEEDETDAEFDEEDLDDEEMFDWHRKSWERRCSRRIGSFEDESKKLLTSYHLSSADSLFLSSYWISVRSSRRHKCIDLP